MGVDVQMTPAREGATDIFHCWFRGDGLQNYWLSIRKDFANGPTEPTNSIRRLALMGYSTSVHPVGYQRMGAANPRVGGVAQQARHESTWSLIIPTSSIYFHSV
jgi:hypothetical protein